MRRVVVGDLDRFDPHAERAFAEVGDTAGPIDGTLVVLGITGHPVTDAYVHGSLREVLTADGRGIGRSANSCAIDGPDDGVLFPVDGIRVVSRSSVRDGMRLAAIVGGGVTLAEVVGLTLTTMRADELPIDLVEIIRL